MLIVWWRNLKMRWQNGALGTCMRLLLQISFFIRFFTVSHYIDSCLVMSSSSVDISNTGLRRSSVLSTYSTSSVTTVQNERTPLVPKANDTLTSPTTYRKEVHWLFANSLPIVVTYMLQTSLQMASVFSLGHIVSYFSIIQQTLRSIGIAALNYYL